MAQCGPDTLAFIPSHDGQEKNWWVHWFLKVDDEIAILLETENPLPMGWLRLPREEMGVPIRLSIELPDGTTYCADSFVDPENPYHQHAMALMLRQPDAYIHVITNEGLWWVATKKVTNVWKDVWDFTKALP